MVYQTCYFFYGDDNISKKMSPPSVFHAPSCHHVAAQGEMRLAYHRKPTCDVGRIGVKTMDVAGFQMENNSKIKRNQMISNAAVENLENLENP